ncbi:replication initiation protein (plasmid) [Bacillus sp. N447-1]|uniref:Replication initiation protein n=1 Tax=Bacillus thuringiensis TaxID=1428 RepID=A0A9X7GBJ4_BACTU|nr:MULTISPECIES: replication initiation protein [Bacillus]MED4441699.1 replication initiation protein [Bacillus cereus]MED3526424.1 replication initiation protein [Bacillus thuringiensis]PFV26280.1 replication initiation protein [Bacillus thuringiensis]UNT71744.1 replication initiation protein [Bacillus sp. N447-1]SFM33030.1 Protein involved in initiation of plasmid replication [Bacillus sp. 5mfcol3.1]
MTYVDMSINQDLQIRENNIVSKSNTLIEANSRLNLVEQKMLLCLASNIEPNDRDFKTYTFPIKQFHDLLGLNGSTKYTELSKITKELLSKVIEIRAGEELIQVSWLSSAIYNRNKGTIDMRFDPLLKPFLLELSSKFTSYRLANVVKLKSTYAIRIYELLKQYEDLKERTISLENLRYYLDAMDVYPNYANFKQRVLKPSQKELNQKTDISFEFEEIKLGRKVQKIRFIIRAQKKKDSDIVHFEKKLDKFQQPNTFEQKIKRFEERCKEKVFPKVFEKWAAHKEIVLEIIEDIRFRSDIDSPIGYVEFILNSRLKELSDQQISNESIQNEDDSNNTLLEIDTIIDSVITKYSTSTGTVATFLVKDTTIEELVKVVTLEEAEAIWKEKETFVMDKIYEFIKRNRSKKRY